MRRLAPPIVATLMLRVHDLLAMERGAGLQPLTAYTDTTVGALIFNIDADTEQNHAFLNVLAAASRRKSSREARQDYIDRLDSYVWAFHRTLFVHEWYHVLQVVSYPALYLRCLRENRLVEKVFQDLRNAALPEIPLGSPISRDWLMGLSRSARPYRVSIAADGELSFGQGDFENPLPNDLTEAQLLEEDASIFQYKVEIGGEGSGGGYRQWLAERGRYTMTFKFLSRVLGNENAYLALQPLVRIAFTTTWPIETFASIVALTVKQLADLPSALGVDKYYEMITRWVEESPNLGRRVPSPDNPGLGDESAYLGGLGFSQLLEMNKGIPHYYLAKELREEFAKGSSHGDWLFHPYRIFDRERETVPDQVQSYGPPLLVYRLAHPSLSVNDSVAVINGRFAREPWPLSSEVTWDQWLFQLLERKQLVWSLVTPFYLVNPHNCVHTNCPLFPSDLCRRWSPIPDDFRNCQFPEWLRMSAHRTFDPHKNALILANE